MAAAVKLFRAHVIEDEFGDAKRFIRALKRSRIFAYGLSGSLNQYLDRAKDADVISLDARINNKITPSLKAAKRLISRNPAQSIVFVTRLPREVTDSPGNFIIEKYTPASESYVSTLFMLMVNDKTLSLLALAANLLKEPVEPNLEEFFKKVRLFRGALIGSSNFLTEIGIAPQKYKRLVNLLGSVAEQPYQGVDFAGFMRFFCTALLDTMIENLIQLKQIKGVYTTPRLETKVRELIIQILNEKGAEPLLHYYLDEAITELDARNLVAYEYGREPQKGVLYRFAGFIGSWLGRIEANHSRSRALEEADIVEQEEAPTASSLYLNISFSDRPFECGWLVVGIAAELLVNIGPLREQGQMSESAILSEEAESLMYSTEYVDVTVLCPGADVVPLRERLPLPPDPKKDACFQVTPLRAGILELTVELLIRNEPIQRTPYAFEVRESDEATESN